MRSSVRVTLLAVLGASCTGPVRLARDVPDSRRQVAPLTLEDPAIRGSFTVRTLYYGSGTDRRRREFRDSVAFRTSPVDASKLLPQYTRDKRWAKGRKKYWGFGPDSFPRNGRLWQPEGDGPFPLVLIVHGNHNMKEFSDPGYAYLGEHLASRGYIVASVDENFLNGNIRGENHARAWMLLKHLELFREWNAAEGHPLRGRIDMERIALIGHSRGGESAAHAATFNRLARLPDDATISLGFGFGIRSVIAIAPSDGQYSPANRLQPMRDVHYLVVHGSHDGDVTSFMGMRQYQRLQFSEGSSWFKSAVYIYRANHGQFNTVWERRDIGPASWLLDTRPLLDPDAQRRAALVLFTGFLDATLRDRAEYLGIFSDPRRAASWLPNTIYLTRFEWSGTRRLADFEEDVDVTTGAVRGVTISADSPAVWREGIPVFRSKSEPRQNNSVVTIGWTRHVAGTDSLAAPAAYTIEIPDTIVARWGASGGVLLFSIANVGERPPPQQRPGVVVPKQKESGKDKAAKEDTAAIDFTVELTTSDGPTARLPLATYALLRPPLPVRIERWWRTESKRIGKTHEFVLQTVAIPFADAAAAAAGFDASRLRRIRFVFDRTTSGTIALDEIGVAPAHPASGIR